MRAEARHTAEGTVAHVRLSRLLPILLALLILLSLLSLCLGSAALSPTELLKALFLRGDRVHRVILYRLRLPRILAAILGGIGLSVSGALLQSVTDNPLAAPNIIGVNSGAGFAVVLMLAIAPALSHSVAFAAFFGAAAAGALILAVSRALGGSRSALVLAGIALNAILNAVISLLTLLDTDLLVSYHAFSLGTLAGVTYADLVLPAAMILLAAALALLLAPRLDPLVLGDAIASSLGVRARGMRAAAVLLAAASAAGVVSFAGLLGFVGLIVPHLCRRLVGPSLSRLIPTAALLGASLLLAADLAGRLFFYPSELPVGIPMAALGAPFFVWVLFSSRGREGF